MDAIQSKTLRNLVLPVPLIDEQKLILNKYIAINEKITSENNFSLKLRKQKSGLMHDLLTGKVQVSIKTAEVAHV